MRSEIRPIRSADVRAAAGLVHQVGWNQTERDWARFLDARPDGAFGAWAGGALVGSVATIVYGGTLAWVGMVIVDAAHRRRGIGEQLIDRALESLDAAGVPTVRLDATPEGQGLYAKRGFLPELSLERWELIRSEGVRRIPTSPAVLDDALWQIDREVFGADRRDLLQSLADEAPDLAIVIRLDGQIAGYAFGRRGSRGDHLGPWMARDETVAEQLLDVFLERSDRARVYADCFIDSPWSRRLAAARGFRVSRPLARMWRGVRGRPMATAMLGAAAGPEFG